MVGWNAAGHEDRLCRKCSPISDLPVSTSFMNRHYYDGMLTRMQGFSHRYSHTTTRQATLRISETYKPVSANSDACVPRFEQHSIALIRRRAVLDLLALIGWTLKPSWESAQKNTILLSLIRLHFCRCPSHF